MPGDTRVARAARVYMERGWAPTPVRPRSKVPLLTDWPRRRLCAADLGLFSAVGNVGLVLGPSGGGLVDVDCDWPEAALLAPELLPPTSLVHGRPGHPGSHFWYLSPASTAVFSLAQCPAGRKTVVVELRGDGLMTVVPPSTHPTGEVLVWERWGDPAQVQPSDLVRAVGRLAVASALVERGWSASEAVAFVRRSQDQEALDDAEKTLGAGLPLRAWLSGVPRHPGQGARAPAACGQAGRLTQAVLDRVGGVAGVARFLGLALRQGRQACPLHSDSGPRSLQITGPLWRCWAGCGAGNAIHFAAAVRGTSYLDARSWLAHELGLTSPHVSPFRREPEPRPGTERATLD